jgi:glucoamylase
LKVDLPSGPAWHRYSADGYGEHADGSPFDGTGIGRLWPLLTGERAHYALAQGDSAGAQQLLASFEALAGEGGLLPEQTWDAADRPERELFLGRPAGSAMPLVWAHAEYLKLVHSLADGQVFDQPPQTFERYVRRNTGSSLRIWGFNQKLRSIPQGCSLRIVTLASACVRYSTDDWRTMSDSDTRSTGLGAHYVDLPTAEMHAGGCVTFTCFWSEAGRWEGVNFSVGITGP